MILTVKILHCVVIIINIILTVKILHRVVLSYYYSSDSDFDILLAVILTVKILHCLAIVILLAVILTVNIV